MTAKRSGLLLAAYCVAQLLVVLDSSIMTVALPSVAVDLGLGPVPSGPSSTTGSAG
ncbi:MAG: hypothetical protein JWN52_1811 [Actinomycetia bacterium]|nr:hypothetical protein [Actinomycetes bacterium]